MTSPDVIAATLKNMQDSDLLDRWNRQLFSEDAVPIARAEFERRGIEPPVLGAVIEEPGRPTTSHYILLRIARGFFGFIGGIGLLGLIGTVSKIADVSATPSSIWAILIIQLVFTLIFISGFMGLRTWINKLHKKKHGTPQPAMCTEWTL